MTVGRTVAREIARPTKSVAWNPELTLEEQAKVDALAVEIGRRASALQALRKEMGLSQAELADILLTTQSNVSKMESGREIKLATLRKLVEAKGGRLTLHAEFGDRDVVLPV